MKQVVTVAIFMALLSGVAQAAAPTDTREISPHPLGERSIFSDRAVAERIAPVGSVCVEGEECGTQMAAAGDQADAGPRSGETVYNNACATCHASGAAGAPKLGDVAAWEPRIAKGMDTLVKHAWEGFNAMPAKGMCMDCSEEEMKAAVQYMVDESK